MGSFRVTHSHHIPLAWTSKHPQLQPFHHPIVMLGPSDNHPVLCPCSASGCRQIQNFEFPVRQTSACRCGRGKRATSSLTAG